MEKTKILTVRILESEYENLSKFAMQNNLSISSQVRKFIEKGMSVEKYQEDEVNILHNMQLSLKQILDPAVERLAGINAKTAMTSAMGFLYTAFMIYRTSTIEQHPLLDECLAEARNKAIRFVNMGKGNIDGFLEQATVELNMRWEEMK